MEKKVLRLISVTDGEGLIIDADITNSNMSGDALPSDIRFYNVINNIVGDATQVSDFIKACFYNRMLEIYKSIESESKENT